MSRFVEVNLYQGLGVVTINLDYVSSIAPTNNRDARVIITILDGASDSITYYVTDSYEYLSRCAIEKVPA